ncbi:MAG TPA: hypothetical protein VGG84_13105 [Gemmatimonadaceae bacterium]
MRTRFVIAIASLLLPAVLSAQRIPLPRILKPYPTDPDPLPRKPEPIARALAYQRLRISIESYPLVSYVQTSGFANRASSSWMTLGAGAHAEYRLTDLAAASMDLTSSLAGGPVFLRTAELGTRIHAQRSERQLDPFVDLRVGYLTSSTGELGALVSSPYGVPAVNTPYTSQYSHGWGGIVGGGLEYGLTRTFSVTTALLATRYSMTAHDLSSTSTADPSFALTSLRFTLGFTYNPVRTIYR